MRAFENRRLKAKEQQPTHLLDAVRGWKAVASRPFEAPATHGRTARLTVVHLAFGQLTVLPPRWEKRCGQDLLGLWAIQVWEEQTPAGEEPLEWLLLTSLSTATLDQAWERVNWSAHRWVVEEYHQCLKTGCRLEERQVQSAARLMRLLGLLSPLAVRLLQLRDLSRKAPECSAPPGPRSRFARRCCRIDWSDSWLENALERLAVCPDAA